MVPPTGQVQLFGANPRNWKKLLGKEAAELLANGERQKQRQNQTRTARTPRITRTKEGLNAVEM
jgi:hypothetical protein